MKKMNLHLALENELDFDFRADLSYIETIDEFNEKIMTPYNDGKKIFYRGERKLSFTRPLLPSLYRDKSLLFDDNEKISLITVNELYDIYKSQTSYFDLYEKIIGTIDTSNMYPFLAFSQHYFGISPFIDLTKNPYVALSFALKDREIYEQDILIYTVEPKQDEDFTDNVSVANSWIKDYSVLVFNDTYSNRLEIEKPLNVLNDLKLIFDKNKGNNFFDMNSPSAKLIDVPTNDLMKYQQGVFLLLDDFSLLGKSYLTKKIRDDFAVKKWVINKNICPKLLNLLLEKCPYYAYENITDLTKVVSQIKKAKNV